MDSFYRERFLRNIGIMNEAQLLRIKNTRIAMGGLGLGGSVFINLVRTGFEKFHIADPDVYERTNINRQRLAKEPTLGRRKDDSLLEEARAINPSIEVEVFREGVKQHNVAQFLNGVDWVVDVVDLFAMLDKLALNEEAHIRKIPVASCGALGFGGAVVVFDQQGPSFAELTGISRDNSYEENSRRFLQFITPEIPAYMEKQLLRALNRSTHIPFVVPGVEIAAAIATTEIAKQILQLGEKVVAPYGIYFDPVNLRIQKFLASYQARVVGAPERKAA
ncbi:MAG: hypothetical protein A2X94_00500 [Bdellovibrionales bacterium GWB1_55_8]|nr:MAG: hypothetical protein A2X94_00500 [Bdellovibrionales bacterium GWB1_55_8]